jgi:choline dehydrogenase-like flavoprotein
LVAVLEAGGGKSDTQAARSNATDVVTAHHAALELSAYRGVGGTSRLWGGRCVALDDIDFAERSHVPFSGWPISHAEVAAYYSEALTFLGCGQNSTPVPTGVAGGGISMAMIERWSAKPDLGRLHERHLRSSKEIRIYPGSMVTGIEFDSDGQKVSALTAKRHGRAVEMKAGAYVLAGGGLENARLLLATQRDWPRKFGGPDGALGRFYMGHLTGYIAKVRFDRGDFAERLWYQKGTAGSFVRRRLSITPEAQVAHALLNTAFWLDSFSVADPAHGSGALSMIYVALATLGLYERLGSGLAPSTVSLKPRGYAEHWSNVLNDPELAKHMLQVLSHFVRNGMRRRVYALINPQSRYLLRYHAEQAPDPNNRVQLGEDRDGSPLPSVRVDYRFLSEDAASVLRAHELLDNWLRGDAFGHLEYLFPPERRAEQVIDQARDGYHQIGPTRMSASPRDGVVNADCRVHDAANLFVAGSSVFPTAGQANPTLPAVALALRLGDHLARTLGAGRA